VEERARALIAEEMSLRDLRKARKQTQVRVAKELGINQENVSRIEKRSDLLLSTLSGYVEAMGGTLRLVAEFPDRPPVALTGIAALDKENTPAKS
jgi:transcriptional regulator with XRE-family HTH domain